MSANDTEFPELIRTRAAGQWSPWDIVIAFALEGWGSPVAALLWVLAYADGRHSLLDIAIRAKAPFARIAAAARILEDHDLLGPA